MRRRRFKLTHDRAPGDVVVMTAVVRDLKLLMGDDVEQRKHFIQTNANDVRFLDI